MQVPVLCSRCLAPWPGEALNTPDFIPCPSCGSVGRVEVYPAYFRGLQPGALAENVLNEGEAACFYHPQKKALVPCDACGRFLCAVCDCELNGQHLCPVCLDTGQKKGRLKTLQNHRTLYDDLALALAVFPLLIFYFTIVTAPVALYVSLRYWHAAGSILPRTKIRFLIAIVLASLEILGWVVGLIYLLTRH
jgi:hypothetical protein